MMMVMMMMMLLSMKTEFMMSYLRCVLVFLMLYAEFFYNIDHLLHMPSSAMPNVIYE